MTIYELKRLNIANGGIFFSKEAMVGELMRDWSVKKTPGQPGYLNVTHKPTGRMHQFNATTGRVDYPKA